MPEIAKTAVGDFIRNHKKSKVLMTDRAGHVIMSVSELEQAKSVQSERRMSIMTDFEEIVKHEVRVMI